MSETIRPHFSFSQLSMFLRCSMQYYFRYVLGLKERPNLNLTRGIAGHKALEINARHKMTTGEDQTSEEIIDNFTTHFDKKFTELTPEDIEPGEDPGKEKDLTIEVLRTWRLKPEHAASITPKAVELEFTMPLPVSDEFPEEIKPITGRIDQINERARIVTPNGKPVTRTEVLDEKFPARKPSNTQDLVDLSDQLTMYDMVLTNANVPTADLGMEHFIPPTKTLGPRIERTYRSLRLITPEARATRQQRLLYKLRQAARQIAAGIFIPTDDPRTCSWCGFRDRCQLSLVKSDYDALLIRNKESA